MVIRTLIGIIGNGATRAEAREDMLDRLKDYNELEDCGVQGCDCPDDRAMPSDGDFVRSRGPGGMMKTITTATEKQWQQIADLKDRWIDNQTQQHSWESVRDIVNRMYADLGLSCPLVFQLSSPMAIVIGSAIVSLLGSQLRSQLGSQLRRQLDSQLDSQLRSQLHSQLLSQLDSQLDSQLRSQPFFIGYWWRAWSGFYEGGRILGVEFDNQQLELFREWNERAATWCAYDKACFVSSNPQSISWRDGVLHNEAGPAVRWPDGYSMWAIGGVQVDKQIVMSPASQKLLQIDQESNAEVKRIRIDRYGWERYLRAKRAKVIEHRRNEIEQTDESLMRCGDMTVLVCACPSTARTYAIEVDPACKTVEQAQHFLSGGRARRLIGAS